MAGAHVLRGFERLNETVYYCKPNDSSARGRLQNSNPPDVILFCSWAGAPLKAVSKYTSKYQQLFPSTEIILVTTSFWDMVTEASQQRPLAPVLDILSSKKDARILVHVFSNGGTYKLIELAKAYRRAFGSLLPITTLNIDSAPGLAHFGFTMQAFATLLPKAWYLYYPGVMGLWAYLLALNAYWTVTGTAPIVNRTSEALNDPELITMKSRRLYLFSKEDEMVWWKDIVAHSNFARKKGFSVTLEEFSGSKHVAHAVQGPETYWTLVTGLWRNDH